MGAGGEAYGPNAWNMPEWLGGMAVRLGLLCWELLDPGVAGEAGLISAYTRVKYGQGQISEGDLALAEQYYRDHFSS